MGMIYPGESFVQKIKKGEVITDSDINSCMKKFLYLSLKKDVNEEKDNFNSLKKHSKLYHDLDFLSSEDEKPMEKLEKEFSSLCKKYGSEDEENDAFMKKNFENIMWKFKNCELVDDLDFLEKQENYDVGFNKRHLSLPKSETGFTSGFKKYGSEDDEANAKFLKKNFETEFSDEEKVKLVKSFFGNEMKNEEYDDVLHFLSEEERSEAEFNKRYLPLPKSKKEFTSSCKKYGNEDEANGKFLNKNFEMEFSEQGKVKLVKSFFRNEMKNDEFNDVLHFLSAEKKSEAEFNKRRLPKSEVIDYKVLTNLKELVAAEEKGDRVQVVQVNGYNGKSSSSKKSKKRKQLLEEELLNPYPLLHKLRWRMNI